MKPFTLNTLVSAAFLGFSLLYCLPSLGQAAAPQVKTFQGVARNEAGEIVYIENHRLVYKNGRHQQNQTRYVDATGSEMAVLDADFSVHPYTPSYRFQDKRFDREDGTLVSEDTVKVYGRGHKDSARRENTLPLTQNMMTGQGLHFFIRDHLEELVQTGASKRVKFLVPLQGKSYDFRILPSAKDQRAITFKIEADSWFLRLFAPSLEVTYDMATKRLLSYKGISNILGSDKKIQNVVITYHYDGEFISKAGSRL